MLTPRDFPEENRVDSRSCAPLRPQIATVDYAAMRLALGLSALTARRLSRQIGAAARAHAGGEITRAQLGRRTAAATRGAVAA